MPEPVTIAAVGVGAVGGWAWLRKKLGAPIPPAPAPGCTSAQQAAVAQQTVASTAGGAATGAAAGPIGAGVGAGVGALNGIFGLAGGPCGAALGKGISKAVGDVGKTACAKADAIYAEIQKRGGTIPGYAKLTCDQKLAACVAAASPLGIVVVGGVIVVGNSIDGISNLNKNIGRVTGIHTGVSTTGASVSAGNSGVTVSTSGGSASVGGVKVASW